MNIKEKIKEIIEKSIDQKVDFSVEIPAEKSHGDYSTNVALILAKKENKNPKEIAKLIKENLELFPPPCAPALGWGKIEVAGPGFINIFISKEVIVENLKKIDKSFGKNTELKNQKIIIDYTDPNPFKEFHIGHLMSNAIGESLSRIFEAQGAKVKRVCYQGDVGMHVAKAIWGKIKDNKKTWGEAYALGAAAFEENEEAKKEIKELNKKIFERTDKKINKLYDEGKKESLADFDKIYKKLGTKFDWLIFESETGPVGKNIVKKGLKEGVFEKGENGAIIFKGEKYGLHTRVFINSESLPTYEAKDLGLAKIKYKKYAYDQSVVVTGNEINEYFKVMLCALKQISPKLAERTKHIGHGMMRLPEGKMSSRTGKVITGESLIEKVQEMVLEKISAKGGPASGGKDFLEKEKQHITEKVAIGAIKYSVLKQSAGSDIIYDFDKSISFDGDSGPYLQYAYARASSVLEKAKKEGIKASFAKVSVELSQLEKSIIHFPEIVLKAGKEYEPHFLVLYLTELAGVFNNYYAKNKIVDKADKFSPYKVALTKVFCQIMKNGMQMLGIETLNKM